MELYTPDNDVEKRLSEMADSKLIPLGGTLELLPLCNMNCRMCYVRMNKEEMDAQGSMLSCEEWLRIADEAKKEGTLFLTLTGGEPLLYPEFKALFSGLKERGFILSVNSNGTLIDEEWADFFAEKGCRRISITLYGADDQTYADLCNNPKGFTQVMRAARLLKERNVAFRFTCSVTPNNVHQLPRLHEIARSMGVSLAATTYMFPAARRGIDAQNQYRLSPQEAALAMVENFALKTPNVPIELAAKNTIEKRTEQPRLRRIQNGFACKAGRSGFWMNWKGELAACGMLSTPSISLVEHDFKTCWQHILLACAKTPQCRTCHDCPGQNICQVCPAVCFAETGRINGCPKYQCEMTAEVIRLCIEYIERAKE